MNCTHQCYSGDETKKNEIGGACGTYGQQEGFWWGHLNKKHLEDLCIDGRIILK
jgi:hypothetical protein